MSIQLCKKILSNKKLFNILTTRCVNKIDESKFHGTGRNESAYEGDGKTKVNILNRELDLGLMINSYSQFGFRLNNGLKIVGPMAIFPR